MEIQNIFNERGVSFVLFFPVAVLLLSELSNGVAVG